MRKVKKAEIKVEKFNNIECEGDRINTGFGTNTSRFILTIHHFQTSILGCTGDNVFFYLYHSNSKGEIFDL